jgi:hypothetical protein
MLMRVIAWLIWGILLITFLAYIPIMQHLSEQPFDSTRLQSWQQMTLVIVLVLVVLIEAIITIWLRRRFLIRPLQNRTLSLSTLKGQLRFILIHIANWLITSLIATTGLVFAIITMVSSTSYVFFLVYGGLMLFHSPRLAPYQQQMKVKD